MLLTLGKISKGDYGEESLTSRFLLSLILNEYSIVNMPKGQAFCKFGKRCLGLELSPEDMNRATATVEFKANGFFDALLTLEPDYIWGIECKYFNGLKEDQIRKEVKAIKKLGEDFKYKNAGVLFVAPEEKLGSMVKDNNLVCECLLSFIQAERPHIRVISWEIIFEILLRTGSKKLSKELEEYCKLRNENTRYPEKLYTNAQTRDWRQWQMYITAKIPIPTDIRCCSGRKSWDVSATSTIEEVCGQYANLGKQIIELCDLKPVPRKTGYIDLKLQKDDKEVTVAQIHALDDHEDGLGLAIGDAGEDLPRCQMLQTMDIRGLAGYKRSGACQGWLEGKRVTNRPAAAFHVPTELENNPEHPVWKNKEVEALLEYARTRNC